MTGFFDFFTGKAAKPVATHSIASPDSLYSYTNLIVNTPKPRTYSNPEQLQKVAKSLFEEWTQQGHLPKMQSFKVQSSEYNNVMIHYGPTGGARLVIGAHYDVAGDQPGADDNASGVAGLLELGRLLALYKPKLNYQVDLVAFCLEEPPFFGGSQMGSAIHAQALKDEKVDVKLMISLEMIGYFTEEENSQGYPLDSLKYLYPNQGNFIAVVGRMDSVGLVRKTKSLLQKHSQIKVESINAPEALPGVGLSDHRSYWEEGYKAVMITDTAFFRNPHYHTSHDRIETLDFQKMAEVINGVYGLIQEF